MEINKPLPSNAQIKPIKVVSKIELPDYVTETHNPKNQKQVEEVVITNPWKNWLKNVTLIDTPGIGSVYKHNTDAAYEYVTKADIGLFVLSPDPPISEAELAFLQSIKAHIGKILFIQNKIDQVDAEAQKESLNFTKQVIQAELGIDNLTIYPVSPKEGLTGKLNKNRALLEHSQINNLETILEQLVKKSRQKLIDLSHAKKILILLSDIQNQLSIIHKASSMSLQALQQRISEFKSKTAEISQNRDDMRAIIITQVTKLVDEILVDDIGAFQRHQTPRMLSDFTSFTNKHHALSNKEYLIHFETYLKTTIKKAFTLWREEEEKIKDYLGNLMNRFAYQTNQSIQELNDISKSLFKSNVSIMKVNININEKTDFRFSFDEYKVELDMFTPLVSKLPSSIAKKLLNDRMKERIIVEFDRHCGRSRYDFKQRILAEVDRHIDELDNRFEQIQKMLLEGLSLSLKNKESQTKSTHSLNGLISTDLKALKDIEKNLIKILNKNAY